MSISDESTIAVSREGMKSMKQNSNAFWSHVMIGGVPGLLLGTAGSLFADNLLSRDDDNATTEEDNKDEIEVLKDEVSALKEEVSSLREELEEANARHSSLVPPIGDTVRVAHGVSDSMSFSEAFAAARAEVGPGGVFTWHGNVYGTYYKNEWDSMSASQKQEYANAVHHTDYNGDHSSHGAGNDYQETSDAEGEIHVLGEEQVRTEDGNLVHVTRVEVDGHYGEVYDLNNDGQADAALIDITGDGQPDIALVDENGDGVIDEGEVYLLPGSGMMNVGNDLYGDMPDYTNDADASSFI